MGEVEAETGQNKDIELVRGVCQCRQGRVVFGRNGSGGDARAGGDWECGKIKMRVMHWVILVKTDTMLAEAVGRVLEIKTIQCRL